MPPGCELYIFNCYIYCDLCLIIKKLVYSYIETVSLKVTHLDPKHKRCFIWKVNYCHCYLCTLYLRSKGNIDRMETSSPLSASNIDGKFLIYVFYLYSLSECEYNFHYV